MPKKKVQQDQSQNSVDSVATQPAPAQSGPFSGQPAPDSKRGALLLYLAIIIIVVIIAAIGYFAYTSLSAPNTTGQKQLSNLSTNSTLTTNQSMFLADLEKSYSLNALHVTYYSANATQYVKQPNNVTMAISNNQSIDSYKLGNYNKTVIINVIAYTNAGTKQIIAKNISSLYYYNSNTTITCFNQSSYYTGTTNASLQCSQGDAGQSYLEEFPFTAANVSSVGYAVVGTNLTYSGVKTILGRNCDAFVVSNETPSNLLSNYTVISMCLDSQYGIPLYFNQTIVAGGIPSYSVALTATAFSTNVSSSQFVIPPAYLQNESKPLI